MTMYDVENNIIAVLTSFSRGIKTTNKEFIILISIMKTEFTMKK